jgi:hypothetical protein
MRINQSINPPPPPAGQTGTAPENNNGHRFDYIEYFQNVLQRLGGDPLANRELATVITDKQMIVIITVNPIQNSTRTPVKR